MAPHALPQLGADGRILEGIVTSENSDGTINVAPMGPIVDATMATLALRPFSTSTTFQNLTRGRTGVFHVTDDVLLFARAATGQVEPRLKYLEGHSLVLANSCRWYAFEIVSIDDSQDRTLMEARVTQSGRLRDFFGFNRAKHAVIEAAILATRVQFWPADQLFIELARLKPLVDKTGSTEEQQAFALLQKYVEQHVAHISSHGGRAT